MKFSHFRILVEESMYCALSVRMQFPAKDRQVRSAAAFFSSLLELPNSELT